MRNNTTTIDPTAQLGRDVMAYVGELGSKSRKDKKKPTLPKANTLKDNPALFAWKSTGTTSDKPVAPKLSTGTEPGLRVSNLLSKHAKAVEGVDFVTGKDGFRRPVHLSINQVVAKWNDTFKSPIFSSLFLGAIPAAAFWGIHKYLNPDEEGTEGQTIEIAAGKLIDADEKAGKPLRDRQYYIDQALENQRKGRWKTALGVWLGSSALAHLWNVNPKDWSSLYRFKNPAGLEKKNSMLGAHSAVDFNTLQSVIAFNPSMAPEIKQSALNVLNYDPRPIMTSTNIINNAIYSGESAKTGLPIGRIISSAVVDGLGGYGIGKLLGIGSPKRLGLLTGVGSALHNALSYTIDNK